MFSSLKPSMVGIITPASSATVAGKPKLGSMNCKRPQGEQKIPWKIWNLPSHPRKLNNSSHSPHQRAPLFGAPSSWFIYRSDAKHSQHVPSVSSSKCPEKTTCYANPPVQHDLHFARTSRTFPWPAQRAQRGTAALVLCAASFASPRGKAATW